MVGKLSSSQLHQKGCKLFFGRRRLALSLSRGVTLVKALNFLQLQYEMGLKTYKLSQVVVRA